MLLCTQALGLEDKPPKPATNLDDFTSLLGLNDARLLVDLLKLAVAKRVGPTAKETISTVLISKYVNCWSSHHEYHNFHYFIHWLNVVVAIGESRF